MQRSGTTLEGRILSKNPALHIIHEPLNKEYGLKGVEQVYPCDLSKEQGVFYLESLYSFLNGKAGYIRHSTLDSLPKALARRISGGRTAVDYMKLRLKVLSGQRPMPVLKDPFEVLLSEKLIENQHKVIALIRHPAAIWHSIKRMGWAFSYLNFDFPQIFRELGIETPAPPSDDLSEIEKFAWLWVVIYSYLLRLVDKEGFLLIKHEDLCIAPYEELERMEIFFEVNKSSYSRDFINRNMFANTVTPSGNQIHAFERDSASLASAWCGKLGKEEDTIQKICGSLVEKYYGSWSPR